MACEDHGHILLCLFFACVAGKKPEAPHFDHHGWWSDDAITPSFPNHKFITIDDKLTSKPGVFNQCYVVCVQVMHDYVCFIAPIHYCVELKGLAMIFAGQENPYIIFRSKEIYIYFKRNNKIPIKLLK